MLEDMLAEHATAADSAAWLKTYWANPEVQKLVDADIKWRMRNGFNQYKQAVYNALFHNKNYQIMAEVTATSQVYTPTNSKTSDVKLKFTAQQLTILAVSEHAGYGEQAEGGSGGSGGGRDSSEESEDEEATSSSKRRNPSPNKKGFGRAKRSKRD